MNREINGDREIIRKRKNGHDEDDKDLELTLEAPGRRPVRPRLVPAAQPVDPVVQYPRRVSPSTRAVWTHSYAAPPPQQVMYAQEVALARRPRGRRNPTRDGKGETVPPPFPWATNRRATVHSLSYLIDNKLFIIYGDVQCKRCERQDRIGFELRQKLKEVSELIRERRSSMHDRAPSAWMNPVLPRCRMCRHENSLKPIMAEKKKAINWLFLLLGQLLGCCTLEQLKYFCKHTKNHRTGAKDRVLYLTYLGLCKQLDPNGPFDR